MPEMKNSLPTAAFGQNAVASMFVVTSIDRVTMSPGIGQSFGAGLRR